jgi:CheY-like chemotaxis protein/phosphoribosyl 1,2-cyclic phosphodiesterase
LRVRFWGTRGSLPKPGAATLRYGGNTSCVEVQADDGTRIVLDSGSGIHELGLALLRAGEAGRSGHLLIGHTHWDHIQGFPFFAPLFVPDAHWDVYGPGGRAQQLEASLASLMSYAHHPVSLDGLEAQVALHDLREGEFSAGPFRVVTQYLHHPTLTLGYRLECDGAALVYATDHEPHSLHPLDGGPGAAPVHHEDQRHVRFLEGADLVIHDGQYTLSHYPAHAGWGHSPAERVVDYAVAAGVRRLALFHHDPEHDDGSVDSIVERASERASKVRHGPEVFAAAEGAGLWLRAGAAGVARALPPRPPAVLPGGAQRLATLLLVEDDPDMQELLRATLAHEQVRILAAGDGEQALRLARTEEPTLVLLDLNLPGCDGLEVCRALRAEPSERLRHLPILVLTGARLEEQNVLEAFVAGATDFLVKPIKPSLLRSRVRGWLLRL